MKKYIALVPLLLVTLLFGSLCANAQVPRISDLPGTVTINNGESDLNGARHFCFTLYPTTPDGNVPDDGSTGLYYYDVPADMTLYAMDHTPPGVSAALTTAPTTDDVTFDVNADGGTILGDKLSIDAAENNDSTAATPATITDSTLTARQVISVDVDDDDGGETAAGARITLCGYFPD